MYYIIATIIPLTIFGTYVGVPQFYDWLYGGPFVYEEAALEAARRLGFDDVSTNLLERVPAVFLEPVLAIALIYAAAPLIAAVLVLAIAGPRGAMATFASRLKPHRHASDWQRAGRIYLSIFALFLAIRLPFMITAGTEHLQFSQILSLSAVSSVLAYAFVDQGGLLEEGGWRGFALPQLMDRLSTPLVASVVIGVLWSFWHLPRDLVSTDKTLVSFATDYGVFTFGTVTTSIIITYFFNRTGGSVWPAVIIHGLINQSFVMVGRYAAGAEYPVILEQPAPTFVLYLTIGIVAALFIWRCGAELGREPPGVDDPVRGVAE